MLPREPGGRGRAVSKVTRLAAGGITRRHFIQGALSGMAIAGLNWWGWPVLAMGSDCLWVTRSATKPLSDCSNGQRQPGNKISPGFEATYGCCWPR